MPYSSHDRLIIRELARRVADVADSPEMAERRRCWYAHNALHSTRPLLLVFPEGAWVELIPEAAVQCDGQQARSIERHLRERMYAFEHFQSDNVVEKTWEVPPAVRDTGWGLEARHQASSEARGSWGFAPVLTCAAELKKLHAPEVSYDREATVRAIEEAQALFGDILQVVDGGLPRISCHLFSLYSGWRGLTETFMDMVDEPTFLHEALSLLEAGYHRHLQQLVDLNLLRLNNNNTYNGSGGNGFTEELPAAGYDPNHVRPGDVWGFAEAQELAQVSPEMYEEFALPYERRLLEPFGLNAYGCCEDLTRKLDLVFTIPHLRRISISPWADVAACAAKLQDRYIFSWKPQPSYLCGDFDPDFVREYLRQALELTRGCVLEIVLKDTHTCQHHPERFDQWTQIARELITESLATA